MHRSLFLILLAGCGQPEHHREVTAPLGGNRLSYHSGSTVSRPKVLTIFWNSTVAGQPTLTRFGNELGNLGLPTHSVLSQYDVNYFPSGVASTVALDESDLDVSALTVENRLRDAINDGRLPSPDGDTLYLVYFPAGAHVQSPKFDDSCSDFSGYHWYALHANSGQEMIYAVIMDCVGSVGSMTATASHEFAEMVTDPYATGWYQDGSSEEIGDLCPISQNVTAPSGVYRVTQLWSNRDGQCEAAAIPPNPHPCHPPYTFWCPRLNHCVCDDCCD